MKNSSHRRSFLTGLGAAMGGVALGGVAAARAATVDTEGERRLHEDWPYLKRYADDDAALIAARAPVDAVFLGDSITEGWLPHDPAFFSVGRVCRGISGQTTPQMLVRFRQDVVALRPRIVHIMAGTNDIAGNTGPSTLQMIQDNLLSMSDIAIANGVRLVFASVPPAAAFPWRPGLETVTPIRTLNGWLAAHAARVRATYADYFTALADAHGGMRAGLSSDGVHPTAEGYAAMRPIAEQALRAAAA